MNYNQVTYCIEFINKFNFFFKWLGTLVIKKNNKSKLIYYESELFYYLIHTNIFFEFR